uniref:hypothetical protein n=1 Tax=Serratia marcescens TaxID=615 RepID=UPI0011E6F0EC
MKISPVTHFTYSNPHPRKSLLASLVLSSLFTCVETVRAQDQVVVSAGNEVMLSGEVIETQGDNKTAVSVRDPGSLATLTDSGVFTEGINAIGLSVAN